MAHVIFIEEIGPIRLDRPDFWQLDNPVFPGRTTDVTDVMLVQGMLVVFAMSNVVKESRRAEARGLVTSTGGKRFDDGIYGPKTRALLKIFEDHIEAPVKDGIVRPTPREFVLIPGLHAKLGRLNDIWDFVMADGAAGSTKKEQASALNPIVRRRLYSV